MNYGLLTVHMIQARHLSSARNQQLNTFVMISLIPEDTDVTPTRCRTATFTDSTCPSYNEKFSFEVGDDDAHRRLLLTVYHRDCFGIHVSLGCTSFGIRNLQEGNREVSGWYHLLTDSVGRNKHLRVTIKDRPSVPVMQSREPRQIPAVNGDVPDLQHLELTIYRSQYGGFGFTVVDSCPVKIGRVDGSSNAQEAGLQKGDLVIRVNGQNVSRSTSVSVARCIKKSNSRVQLEVQRPGHYTTPTPLRTSAVKSSSEESGNTSVQEFTICDDRTALLNSATSVDTRRQAALHRLLCLEENFVDFMNTGIQKFSRPLRHCVLTSTQHATLFQNIEKIVCMSQYQVHQILDNLPSYTPSDNDDTDNSFVGESDLTSAVAMIYLSKLPVICGAYMTYSQGLSRTASLLGSLEKNDQFCGFLLNVSREGKELSLCDFINRPLAHMQDLCGLLQIVCDTTMPHSEERAMLSDILLGLQSVVDQISHTATVTSSFQTRIQNVCHLSIPSQRRVPLMGSLVLKRSSSERSSSSGFGSGSSQQSDIPLCTSETEIVFCDHNIFLSTLV
ncbi:uncharacterized protein LOC123547608 [Mercenaria mercenaria]|uniref:uncharacterized protein LOC123547608 n=1 Tax=Mercenaria mercenaria TaxID=6596 RepID=UPI00234F69C4|nr:uncharacterized protein LOC123547608 [Mercenaria mercenaria]